jgi:hypothetical protein
MMGASGAPRRPGRCHRQRETHAPRGGRRLMPAMLGAEVARTIVGATDEGRSELPRKMSPSAFHEVQSCSLARGSC